MKEIVGIDKLVEAFKLLSNKTNIEILILLSSGEFNPRELAKALGRDETDVSRRLRRLERAGLVAAEWRRVAGRNVRMYRLRGRRFCLRLTEKGAILDTSRPGLDPVALARSVGMSLSAPRPPRLFAGRERELELLSSIKNGLIVVIGIPGSGKTSLLAEAAERWSGPIAWYNVTGLEGVQSLLWKLSLYLSLLGETALFNYVEAGSIDVEAAARILARSMDRLGLTIVLDNFHRVNDPLISVLVARTASLTESSRIIIATRRRPSSLISEAPAARVIVLGGLDPDSAKKLLLGLGVEISTEKLSALYVATQGHPLLLRLFAELAGREGVEKALDIISRREMGRELWSSIVDGLSEAEAHVLNILIDLAEPVPLELVEDLCRCRTASIALYKLADLGLVEELTDNQYIVRDFLRRICPRRLPKRDILVAAGDWLIENKGVDGFVLAIRLYRRARDEKRLLKAIRRRMMHPSRFLPVLGDIYLKELERVLEDTRSDYVRAYILAELGVLLRGRGRYREAYTYLDQAHRIARMYKDFQLEARVIGLKLWFYPVMIDAGEAERLVEEADNIVDRLDLSNPMHLSSLNIYYSNLARYYALYGLSDKAIEALQRELETAKIMDDELEEALALAHLAIGLGLQGRVEEAVQLAEDALATLLPDAPEILIARARRVLSELYLRAGRLQEAFRHASEAYSVEKKYGELAEAIGLLAIQVLALLMQGSSNAAYGLAREIEEMVKLFEESNNSLKGVELDLLAAAAAYKKAGRDPSILVEKALESLGSRKARLLEPDAEPYIRVLEEVGLRDTAGFLRKITVG